MVIMPGALRAQHLTQKRKDAKSGLDQLISQLLSQLEPLYFSSRSVWQFRNKEITARLLEARQSALTKFAQGLLDPLSRLWGDDKSTHAGQPMVIQTFDYGRGAHFFVPQQNIFNFNW